MTAGDGDWVDLERELQDLLLDGVDIGGTIEEADVRGTLGSRSLGLTIELSDLEGEEQTEAYLVLCDLLFTRRRSGLDEAVGCLVFATEPDPGALMVGLGGMTRPEAPPVPVLPLSHRQAELLAVACRAGTAFLDDATSLVVSAAESTIVTRPVAETLLADIDELVDRRTSQTD